MEKQMSHKCENGRQKNSSRGAAESAGQFWKNNPARTAEQKMTGKQSIKLHWKVIRFI
jgi:SspJ family small acid-soluble spore protein